MFYGQCMIANWVMIPVFRKESQLHHFELHLCELFQHVNLEASEWWEIFRNSTATHNSHILVIASIWLIWGFRIKEMERSTQKVTFPSEQKSVNIWVSLTIMSAYINCFSTWLFIKPSDRLFLTITSVGICRPDCYPYWPKYFQTIRCQLETVFYIAPSKKGFKYES